MLIVMDKKATESEIKVVVTAVEAKGYTARPIPGGDRVSIGVLYNKGAVDTSMFIGYPGVKDVVPVTRPYKLVSREFQTEDTLVNVGDVTIGNGHYAETDVRDAARCLASSNSSLGTMQLSTTTIAICSLSSLSTIARALTRVLIESADREIMLPLISTGS